jgi:hypothetical protein
MEFGGTTILDINDSPLFVPKIYHTNSGIYLEKAYIELNTWLWLYEGILLI